MEHQQSFNRVCLHDFNLRVSLSSLSSLEKLDCEMTMLFLFAACFVLSVGLFAGFVPQSEIILKRTKKSKKRKFIDWIMFLSHLKGKFCLMNPQLNNSPHFIFSLFYSNILYCSFSVIVEKKIKKIVHVTSLSFLLFHSETFSTSLLSSG